MAATVIGLSILGNMTDGGTTEMSTMTCPELNLRLDDLRTDNMQGGMVPGYADWQPGDAEEYVAILDEITQRQNDETTIPCQLN